MPDYFYCNNFLKSAGCLATTRGENYAILRCIMMVEQRQSIIWSLQPALTVDFLAPAGQ